MPLRTTSCQFKTLEMNLHLLHVHPFFLLPVSPAGTSISISFLLTAGFSWRAGAGGNTRCASTVPPSLLAPPVLPQQPWCPPEWLQGREAAALCSRRGQQPAFGLLPLLRQCEAPQMGLGNQGAEGAHQTPLQPLSPHAELLS